MNPSALRAGLPDIVTHANTFTRGTYSYLSRVAARQPTMPTLQQIDARLRRCMDTALQTYYTSATPYRLVVISALQISGRKLPYLFGVLVTDTFNRYTSHCLQPMVPIPDFESTPLTTAFWRENSWLERSRIAMREFRKSVTTMFHVLRLIVLFTPLLLSAPLVFYCGISREAWMEQLRETMEYAGPAFIKWGQWAATRQDMFPPDMCRSLAQLQSNAPKHRCVANCPSYFRELSILYSENAGSCICEAVVILPHLLVLIHPTPVFHLSFL
jgi:hypothetical protein